MADCKHEFVYDELHLEIVCKKCFHVLTKEERREALEYGMAMLRADEIKEEKK